MNRIPHAEWPRFGALKIFGIPLSVSLGMEDVQDSLSEDWEIDDTLLGSSHHASDAGIRSSDAPVQSDPPNQSSSNSFIRISLTDIEKNQRLSRTLPYERIVLRA